MMWEHTSGLAIQRVAGNSRKFQLRKIDLVLRKIDLVLRKMELVSPDPHRTYRTNGALAVV